jgi:hypothetical protein
VSRAGKLQLLLVVAIAAFWIGIWTWTVTTDAHDPPDFLDDRAFPQAAEPICAAAVEEVTDLGNPAFVETPEERADLVDAQGLVFAAMVDDLRVLPRPAGEQGGWVGEWLDDWETHLGDRARWAERLHDGESPPFVETARDNNQISEAIDNFAEVNEMESCATLGDV